MANSPNEHKAGRRTTARGRKGVHTPQSSSSRGGLSVPTIVVGAALVLALVGGGVAVLATHNSTVSAAGTDHDSTSGGHHSNGGHPRKHHHPKPPALKVVAVSPSKGSSAVAWDSDVTVSYSVPLSAKSPLPSISPAPPGSWDRISATSLEFRPTGSFVPWTKETVTVPATSKSARGVTLGQKVSSSFTVAGASELRLQELLGELGYLPLRFVPKGQSPQPTATATAVTKPPLSYSSSPAAPGTTGTTLVGAPGPVPTSDFEAHNAGDIPLEAVPGKFVWRFSGIPATLAAQWSAGSANEVTTGAVMSFEEAHGLGDDGVAGPEVWGALLNAAAARQMDTEPYDYVYVTEKSPEYVTVWRDGVNVFTTLANTGISQAPTQAGTWPVYVRYTVTTMSGTEPNGQKYKDPGIPWVSYFHGGDALHGYLRSQYGFPQSLGCVEMPFSSAATVYPFTPIGTLVTVE